MAGKSVANDIVSYSFVPFLLSPLISSQPCFTNEEISELEVQCAALTYLAM